MKCPPSSSTAPMDRLTSPIVSHMLSATFLVMYLIGISWTCTQKAACVNASSHIGLSLSYLSKTTKCLSKLQSWLEIILSSSFEFSGTKWAKWSPRWRILNPFDDLQICLKVLATASLFRKREVRNFAATMNSLGLCSFCNENPELSFLEGLIVLKLFCYLVCTHLGRIKFMTIIVALNNIARRTTLGFYVIQE